MFQREPERGSLHVSLSSFVAFVSGNSSSDQRVAERGMLRPHSRKAAFFVVVRTFSFSHLFLSSLVLGSAPSGSSSHSWQPRASWHFPAAIFNYWRFQL